MLRYLTGGGFIFLFNMALTWIAHSFFSVDRTQLVSNISHLIITEVSLLFAFFVHSSFTWAGKGNTLLKIWRFHIVSLFSLGIRFFLFFIMTRYHFDFITATLTGILFSIMLNYLGYDKFVFASSKPPLQKKKSEYVESVNSQPYQKDGKGILALETLEEATNYNKWIASKILPYLKEKNIELGAGTGTISQYTQENKKIILCELSDENIKTLKNRFKKKTNIKKIVKDIKSIKKKNEYDCVYSSNVMEHIEDDMELMEYCLELIKPGGYFVAFVPAGYFLFSKMDRIFAHYRRYDWNDYFRIKHWLHKYSRASLVQYRFFNPVGALGWFIKMKLMGVTKIKKSDVMVMDSLIPYLSKFDVLPLPFGQNILFVIQKDKT